MQIFFVDIVRIQMIPEESKRKRQHFDLAVLDSRNCLHHNMTNIFPQFSVGRLFPISLANGQPAAEYCVYMQFDTLGTKTACFLVQLLSQPSDTSNCDFDFKFDYTAITQASIQLTVFHASHDIAQYAYRHS